MTDFNDLPVELLPVILTFIVKPGHLVHVCLVNRTFDTFARELLYRKVFIYSWHKNVKTKVCDRKRDVSLLYSYHSLVLLRL